VHANDLLCQQFIRVCGDQVRQRGEILLDIDSTDDPTHGQQQLSFFNGGYGQHMYHPMLIFERHTGCLLAARLPAGYRARETYTILGKDEFSERFEIAEPGKYFELHSENRLQRSGEK
jgi:hypothetical protein